MLSEENRLKALALVDDLRQQLDRLILGDPLPMPEYSYFLNRKKYLTGADYSDKMLQTTIEELTKNTQCSHQHVRSYPVGTSPDDYDEHGMCEDCGMDLS